MADFRFVADTGGCTVALRQSFKRGILRKIPENAKISASAPRQLRQGIRSPVAQW